MQRVLVFLALFAFWLILSGHYDPFHIGAGVVCAGLVTLLSSDLFTFGTGARSSFRIGRFALYVPWLLWEILQASLYVTWLVVRPSGIRSRVIRFRTHLRNELAKVVLGNSITLTPGTVTVDIEGDLFTVHALSDTAADALLDGDMERRVAWVFGEDVPGDSAGGTDR